MKFEILPETLSEDVIRYQIIRDGERISFRDWIEAIQESTEFVAFFSDLIRQCPFPACFWEVKPITADRLDEVFEFVLIESKSLPSITADDSFFKPYFESGKSVVAFPNLGGDAMLVVPTPMRDHSAYGHLISFIRSAPEQQVHAFWKQVGETYQQRIGNKPTWLSTAGLGVYWLHVRMDSRPKYYRFHGYKRLV